MINCQIWGTKILQKWFGDQFSICIFTLLTDVVSPYKSPCLWSICPAKRKRNSANLADGAWKNGSWTNALVTRSHIFKTRKERTKERKTERHTYRRKERNKVCCVVIARIRIDLGEKIRIIWQTYTDFKFPYLSFV